MDNKLFAPSAAKWHCEPSVWSAKNGVLSLTTGEKTDFWQETHYGFHRDDGHFLGFGMSRDFTAAVTFDAKYKMRYDQAGMMMRIDERNWLKVGIEFSDNINNFSVVVTRDGKSDWSVVGAPLVKNSQSVRLTRLGAAVIIHYLGSDGGWNLMRLANFPATANVRVGPMACSPQRAGLNVQFTDFSIGAPNGNPLHSA